MGRYSSEWPNPIPQARHACKLLFGTVVERMGRCSHVGIHVRVAEPLPPGKHCPLSSMSSVKTYPRNGMGRMCKSMLLMNLVMMEFACEGSRP